MEKCIELHPHLVGVCYGGTYVSGVSSIPTTKGESTVFTSARVWRTRSQRGSAIPCCIGQGHGSSIHDINGIWGGAHSGQLDVAIEDIRINHSVQHSGSRNHQLGSR